VAFQALPEATVAGHQLVVGDDADALEDGIEQRGGVAFGKDQVVVGRGVRIVPVIAKVARDEHREQVGRGHAGSGMAGAGAGARADRVYPQLGGKFGDGVEAGSGGSHGGS
jgi:hypothetical protein